MRPVAAPESAVDRRAYRRRRNVQLVIRQSFHHAQPLRTQQRQTDDVADLTCDDATGH
jgi:hypothetical protein